MQGDESVQSTDDPQWRAILVERREVVGIVTLNRPAVSTGRRRLVTSLGLLSNAGCERR